MRLDRMFGIFKDIEILGFQDGQSPENEDSLLKLNHPATIEWFQLLEERWKAPWRSDLVGISLENEVTLRINCSPTNLKRHIQKLKEDIMIANNIYTMILQSQVNKKAEERKQQDANKDRMNDLSNELGFKL